MRSLYEMRLRNTKKGWLVLSLILALLLVGSFFYQGVSWEPTPRLGIVDTERLLNAQAKRLAVRYPRARVPAAALQRSASRLRTEVAAFARAHHLILLSSQAVWGGKLPDYTDAVLRLNPMQPHP